jgi:GGDEF domain-containing protein
MQDDIDAFDHFKYTLEWLLAVLERHPDALQFGLIHVCFHNKEALGSRYGARDAVNMLRELASQLRKSFRKTDLVARDTTDFWILVPYTDPATVTEKVSQLVELASDNGLDIVDRDVAVFTLPDPQITNMTAYDSARELLAYLKANRAIAVRWDPVFQPT